jgi:hypothetical protein
MRSQPSARSREPVTADPDEWNLLVRLPGQVVVATTLAVAGPPDRRMAEGLAGIDAVAAGRFSACGLVREVVAAIYAEGDTEPPVPAPPGTSVEGALADCRRAAAVLGRQPRAAADGYRSWLVSVAARTCHARLPGGLAERGTRAAPAAERLFLSRLTAALGA